MIGKFSPAGKVSDLLIHMADEIKKEEAKPSPMPVGIPPQTATHDETPTAQSLSTQREIPNTPTTSHAPSLTQEPAEEDENVQQSEEIDAEAGEEEGGETKAAEEGDEGSEIAGVDKDKGVVVLEEQESSDGKETLDERAARRRLRTRRRLGIEEPREKKEEAATIATADRRAVERKRKGKQIASQSKNRKSRQASLSVVVQEPIEDLTQAPYNQSEEEKEEREEEPTETSESEGVYEKLEVTVDKKLLEAMVYYKDPKKIKDCTGRVTAVKKAKSGKRLHLPSLRGLESEEKFLKYIKAIGFE